jgi:hypothetical protein
MAYQFPAEARKETAMPRLIAPLLALTVVAAAGSASATIYVPGQYRDGVYTHPHFQDAPLVKGVKMESGDAKMPKPIPVDEPQPPKKLPPESSS